MRSRRAPLAGLVAALIAIPGCDTSVDLLTTDGRSLFSVHGYLDAAADTQWVRVEPLRPLVGPGPRQADGVTVESVHLGTGTRERWEPVDRTDADGNPVSAYRAVFRPVEGETYRVEIARDGVIGAVGETRVPPSATLDVPPADTGDGTFVAQRLLFSGAEGSPQQVRIVYRLRAPGSAESRRLAVEYGEVPAIEGGRFVVTVYPSRDRSELLFRLSVPQDTRGVTLEGMAVEYSLLSPEWSYRGPDPGIRSGHGFFASRGVYEVPWRLSPGAVTALGWLDAQGAGKGR